MPKLNAYFEYLLVLKWSELYEILKSYSDMFGDLEGIELAAFEQFLDPINMRDKESCEKQAGGPANLVKWGKPLSVS